jgi:hypothetical protein
MMTTNERHGEREPSEACPDWLKPFRPQDFDGHTAFAELTADQRLDWLQRSADLLRDLRPAPTPSRDS